MFLFQKCFSEHLSHQAGHRALNVKAVEPLWVLGGSSERSVQQPQQSACYWELCLPQVS